MLGVASSEWVRVVGAALVVFAIDVMLLSTSNIRRLTRFGIAVSVGDAIWVGGSIATIAAAWYSKLGVVVIVAVAVMVAAFGVRQLVLVRRLSVASGLAPISPRSELS